MHNPFKFFNIDGSSRGHNLKIHKELLNTQNNCKYNTIRRNFFSNRIVNDWNHLSQEDVESTNSKIELINYLNFKFYTEFALIFLISGFILFYLIVLIQNGCHRMYSYVITISTPGVTAFSLFYSILFYFSLLYCAIKLRYTFELLITLNKIISNTFLQCWWIRNDLLRIRIQLWIFRVPNPDPCGSGSGFSP